MLWPHHLDGRDILGLPAWHVGPRARCLIRLVSIRRLLIVTASCHARLLIGSMLRIAAYVGLPVWRVSGLPAWRIS